MRRKSIAYIAFLVLSVANFSRVYKLGYDYSNADATTPWTLDENHRVVIPQDMILIKSSLLWCPTAKAGTTTVYNVLWKNNLTESIGGDGHRCYPKCPMMASEQLKGLSLSARSKKPLSFVIVRNPYDRLRSAFVSKVLTEKIKLSEGRNRPMKSFSKFVKFVEKYPNRDIHWAPVSSRCLTSKGSSVNSNTKRRTFQYDHVLKIEEVDLPKKLEEIFELAGIDIPAGIDRTPMNQNENADHITSSADILDFYRDAANEGNMTVEELVSAVGRIYIEDVETFGYSFPY